MAHRITLEEARSVLTAYPMAQQRRQGAAVQFVRARAEVLNRMGGMAAWSRLVAASRTLERERSK